VSVRAAGLIERSVIRGADSPSQSRALVTADSVVVGGNSASTSIAVGVLADGLVVFENNIVVGGQTTRTSDGIIMQGNARVRLRHNLVIAGRAASEQSNALRMFANPEREIANNIFVGSAEANAQCVDASQPVVLFANSAFSRCATLWQFGATPLVAIADVNAIVDPNAGSPRITVDNGRQRGRRRRLRR